MELVVGGVLLWLVIGGAVVSVLALLHNVDLRHDTSVVSSSIDSHS